MKYYEVSFLYKNGKDYEWRKERIFNNLESAKKWAFEFSKKHLKNFTGRTGIWELTPPLCFIENGIEEK